MGQRLPGFPSRPGGLPALTVMSRVIVPQPAGAPLSVSVARQVPAAGDATSANQ